MAADHGWRRHHLLRSPVQFTSRYVTRFQGVAGYRLLQIEALERGTLPALSHRFYGEHQVRVRSRSRPHRTHGIVAPVLPDRDETDDVTRPDGQPKVLDQAL